MAFLDLMRQLLNDSSAKSEVDNELLLRAQDLRDVLANDPNDVAAFEELASIVRSLGADRTPADPLTADQPQSDEQTADLILWSLSEDLGSDSRGWYPLIQLARLSIDQDREGALRHLETAADREESGLALAEGLKVLREAGEYDTATQLGLGRWNPSTHTTAVGEELIESALEVNKPEEAARYLVLLRESGADDEIIDELELRIATTE